MFDRTVGQKDIASAKNHASYIGWVTFYSHRKRKGKTAMDYFIAMDVLLYFGSSKC